jgi:PleD family two-component response regulator
MHELAAVSKPATAFPAPLLETLLVEDSEFDRTRIRRISDSSPLAMNFTEAASYAEMEDAICERHFDLILIDYHLGDADGLQAMRLLKRTPLQSSAGIIMITGNERVDIAASAFRDGCDDFIAKSAISPSVFHATVERVMANVHERLTERFNSRQLMEEIRGAVVASLRGQEAQAMIAEAIRSARPDIAPPRLSQSRGFEKIVTVIEDDEFRFI